ncbi:MAG: acyl--CoA ligase [Pseudomonadota bacterium]
MRTTIRALLAAGGDGAPSIGAPDRKALDFKGLRNLVDRTVEALNGMGIGRNDRVAIVLPNGPAMAAAFVAIGAGATTAPLNPAYREEEFSFYLNDLGAKALVLQEGDETPARSAAQKAGLAIIELRPGESGDFALIGDGIDSGPLDWGGFAEPDDIALILHTSGTTSRPKIVPLTQANIAASARHIGETVHLSPDDVCLNIMPLFHIHGLIAAVLSSLAAGGSVVCTPGFNALRFYSWLDTVRPTWITAVPTMYQAILARAARHGDITAETRLRLLRSSSASLPPQVMKRLEETFGCPVIESYGMTEAAHQMTSNRLPPGKRKPGSVGSAAGPEVAILGEGGAHLGAGGIGEIVIRGPNVTHGYEANPSANADAFVDGWFRTGDQGTMDEDGYLHITGRLKELINRGGEKVSPLEVDEILMDHPAVAQVVTFAMPHDKLGEEVAAAIVLREGETATEGDIRDFARKRLADFKVPRTVVFLKEIPKGATGKLQRIGLAQKLGLVPADA